MATTPDATLQARLDSLNQAIADGVRQVTIDNTTVTYNTTDSLIRARDDLITQMKVRRAAQTRLVFAGRGYW